jgi:hypothetical protein
MIIKIKNAIMHCVKGKPHPTLEYPEQKHICIDCQYGLSVQGGSNIHFKRWASQHFNRDDWNRSSYGSVQLALNHPSLPIELFDKKDRNDSTFN